MMNYWISYENIKREKILIFISSAQQHESKVKLTQVGI
jgi:hypothetical protein